MTIRLSRRVLELPTSPTVAADNKAKEMMAAGIPVINLSVGEPDFDTPAAACEAGKKAIDDGETRYGPAVGLPELRRAVAERLNTEQRLDYGVDQILISAGGKPCLSQLFLALLDPGDEVIVPAPYWVSFPSMIRFAGGTPVVIETSPTNGFIPDPEAIKAAITPKTRAILINSPSNPTGAGYPRSVIEAIVELAVEHGLVVVSDEIYRRLCFEGFAPVSPAEISDAGRESTVIINGVSKSYAMTGWRIGWAAGPTALIKAMSKIQSQTLSGPPKINQRAALVAINSCEETVGEMRQTFEERMKRVVETLNAIPGVDCPRPQGAFYVFPDVSSFLGRSTPEGTRVDSAIDLQSYLLDSARVALLAGDPFGAPGHLRLSFAASDEDLATGLSGIAEALGALS